MGEDEDLASKCFPEAAAGVADLSHLLAAAVSIISPKEFSKITRQHLAPPGNVPPDKKHI